MFPSGGSLLARPERTQWAILSEGKIDPLLMGATKVAVGDDDVLHALFGEEVLDLLLDSRIIDDILSRPALKHGPVVVADDNARRNLRCRLVVRAIIRHRPDGIFAVTLLRRGGAAAELVLLAAAAGTRIIGVNFKVACHDSFGSGSSD